MTSNNYFEQIDYLNFFELDTNPFPVAPDDKNFFLSEHINQIISEITHGILTRKGFMTLTGEVGLGKTTISRRIISLLEERGVATSLVLNSAFQGAELIQAINSDFGLDTLYLPENGRIFGEQIKLLNDFLLEQNKKGRNCAILIDDAQNLDHESLETVRMISNLEADQQKLVQILLVGQPELTENLNNKNLRQLKSRVIIKGDVQPLTKADLKNYLFFKLNSAGNNGLLNIQSSAIKKIYKYVRGNIRQLNMLMDRALYVAFIYNTRNITRKIIREACQDIYPEKIKFRKKLLVPAFCMVLLLVGGMLIHSVVYRHYFSKKTSIASKHFLGPPLFDKSLTQSAVFSLPNILVSPKAQTRQGLKREIAVDLIKIPEPVIDFLKDYQIASHAQEFWQAVKTGQYEKISKIIYQASGYELIRLNTLNQEIKEKFGTFTLPSEKAGWKTHFLFWKPGLKLPKFYYRYAGNDVLKLQKMLAQIDLYHDKFDGIVGKNLMLAVIDFQKKMEIPVTGYPNKQMLFLLSQQKCIKKNG